MKIRFIIALILVLALVGCGKTATDAPSQDDFGFITISTSDELLQELDGESVVAEVGWQNVTLSEEDAEKYPELNKRFEEMNAENADYAQSTLEEFLEMAEEFPVELNAWYYYSNKKANLQRADKYIVSIISDYADYTGGAHGYYSNLGINISPETGKDVSLEEVIRDREAFDKLVYDSLLEQEIYEILEENRQSFYETYTEQGYNWSIDYEKLTVYFNPYELASYAAGILTVEVEFEEHPELFFEEYTKAPSLVPQSEADENGAE